LSPAFEGVERSRRIAAGTAPDDLNNLLKLARPELSHDLVDAPLIEQQNSRYHRLRDTLSGGPSQRCTIKYDSESISHGRNISCRQAARIKRVPSDPAPAAIVREFGSGIESLEDSAMPLIANQQLSGE
jgi:hypothetical protein